MDLPDHDTLYVVAEGCARRFGAKIGWQARWAVRQKIKNPTTPLSGQNPLFA